MSEREDLEDLKVKIQEARASSLEDENSTKRKRSPHEEASRIIIELFGGLLVGGWLGYIVDGVFDTKPIFFILLMLLGLAGSVLTIYKQAEQNEHTDE